MRADKPKDECGVFGIYNHKDASRMTQRALYALQHRGEESAGIAVATRRDIDLIKGNGHVDDVFKDGADSLNGSSAIGHVRYSLTGESTVANAQPFVMDRGYPTDHPVDDENIRYDHTFSRRYSHSPLAIAHNGSFLGGLEKICEGSSDTKTFADMLSKSGEKSIRKAVMNLLRSVEGAYCLVLLTPTMLIGARDPAGYRPLSLGSLEGASVIASETCAFNSIGAKHIRDINPGEVIFIDRKGIQSEFVYQVTPPQPRECIFEHLYLSRLDSTIFGESVFDLRLRIGRELAREHPVEGDVVIGVPDAGNLFSQGYANEARILHEPNGLRRNHYYPGRTFIKPDHALRLEGADLKFFAVPEAVKGRRIILIDDSLVRGVNIKESARKLRQSGAQEIHVRIASPPYVSACHWGVDTHDTKLLIALNQRRNEMVARLNIDSLEYLSLGRLVSAFKHPENKCVHCFEEES